METTSQTGAVSGTGTKQPGLLTGLLIGAMVTAPLIALFFLADALAGLPLLPFDLTDWSARNLPGSIVTLTIDTMVSVIRGLNLGRTDEVAKLAERSTGIIGLFVIGVVVGAVLVLIFNRVRRDRVYTVGAVGGLILGTVLALMSGSVNFTATTPSAVNFTFIAGVFVLWGVALAWIYSDLTALSPALPGQRPAPEVSAEQLDRRQFLVRVGGATATLTVVGAGLSVLLRPQDGVTTDVTAADNTTAMTGTPEALATEALVNDGKLQPAPGTRPEITAVNDHYLISISTRYPNIDGESWTLPISGLVNNPRAYTLKDLRAYEALEQIVTMACISNPVGGDLIGTTKWTGVSFQKILDDIQPTEDGKFVKITAADGFDEILDLQLVRDDPTLMLCYAWDDQPLTPAHGFPLRVYIPNHYGMKQPRWITGMEVIPDWEEGYWVRRGWSKEAVMRATSVIDTIAVNHTYEKDGKTYVPIGGIAFAGTRSISKVELSIDDGEWVEADLREPLSDRTWVLWRYDWAFQAGTHSVSVRCVDGEGNPQIETPAPVRPDGATGIFRVSASV